MREGGVKELLGPFRHKGGFDGCLRDLVVTHAEAGVVRAHVPVGLGLQNSYATLHGGAITTIVDVIGTMALMTKDHTRGGVSIEINSCFLNAAAADDVVDVTGTVAKYGKSLGFAEVELFSRRTGKSVAKGRHTKFFP